MVKAASTKKRAAAAVATSPAAAAAAPASKKAKQQQQQQQQSVAQEEQGKVATRVDRAQALRATQALLQHHAKVGGWVFGLDWGGNWMGVSIPSIGWPLAEWIDACNACLG
jgi:hypothetical protein